MAKYVGKRVKRVEDPRFIQGKGNYVANISLPNMVHLAIKRSPYGHAKIKKINIKKAQALEGVVEFVRPSGGFYVFPKTPPSFDSTGAFIEAAIERNLLLIAGEVFSERNSHFRISYAAPNEKLRAGCDIIRDLARA